MTNGQDINNGRSKVSQDPTEPEPKPVRNMNWSILGISMAQGRPSG
jgi:hypothetical protein